MRPARTPVSTLLLASTLSIFAHDAGALPARPDALSFRNNTIRVSLGTFSRPVLAGIDLMIDGKAMLSGNGIFSVHCGVLADGAAFVEYAPGARVFGKMEIKAPSGFFRLNGKLFRNQLTIIPQSEGCLAINTVDIEKYLAGLLNREMAPSWPIEALKAQAVASRSYAVFQMRQNRYLDYDVESTTQDQVYDGAGSETPRSNQAVAATRGLVLSFSKHPVKAYFHANCGGTTELPSAVWGGEVGSFRIVHCPYHKTKRDRRRWSAFITHSQLSGALKKISGTFSNFRAIARVEAAEKDGSGRVAKVAISDSKGARMLVPAPALRAALGNMRVKSTSFHVKESPGGFRLDGEGFGHGVGMCQVGARAMAEAGKSFRRILAHYYPLAKIESL